MERKLTVIIVILVLLATAGCVKETYDIDKISKQVHLSPAFGIPVVRGTVTLSDFVEPSDTIIFDSDSVFVYAEAENVIRFIFRKDSIISFTLDDYYDFDDMLSYSKSFVVGELYLGSFADTIGFSLDEISMKFPPAVRAALVLLDEKTGDFPPFPAVSLDEKTFGPFDNFEYATFSDGIIEITITNNLTIPITDLTIQLNNAVGPAPIGDPFTFTLINPGETLSDSLELENVTLSNSVIAEVSLGADNDGEENVFVDLYNSNIEIAIAGRDLKIKSGRVILPVQEVVSIDEKDTVSFDPGEEVEIDEIKILSGDLNYSLNALVPIKASVTITLPTSLRDGNPVTETLTVNPNTTLNGNISLTNSTIDMGTIATQPYNMLPVNYGLEVSSDGQMVDFNSTDEVSIEMEMLDPGIDYVKGYFGQYGDTIDTDTLDLGIEDVLENLTGSVTLNPSVSLNYRNSFAMPVEIDLDAVGYKGSDSVDIDLDAEILSFPAAPAERDVNDAFTINSANSQLPELISMLPEKIRFGGSAVMNPAGNTGSRDNYIFGDSRFLGDLEIEVPLELRINNLHFADTVDNFMQDAEIDEESPVTPEDVEYLRIQFTAENGFPLGISLTMSLYDSTSASIKSTIDATDILEAASVDSNGRVTEPAQCSTELEITSEFWDAVNDADKIIFNINLVTTDNGTKDVKIYSDYYIEYKVALQVKADINANLDDL